MHKLLIADDEKLIREAIVELIDWEALDIQITASCKNGMETLDAIMDTAPDIVMTDIRMPGLDGLDLIEKLQSLDSHIQFIILTGYPEFDYARRAIKYGVREYLLKPISEEAIIEAVNHVKKSLPVYSNPGIADLVSRLLVCRQEGNTEQARLLLDHFFTHFAKPAELRPVGLNLLMELHTQFLPPSAEDLSHFTEQILSEQNVMNLRDIISRQIISLLFTDSKQKSAFAKTSLADTVKAYVSAHLDDENLSLKYIAENLLYINVSYLSRTFTKQSGEKFSNYINRSRIEKAQRLLRQSGADHIHVIAEAVGFGSNPQYFSQVFKKYTGSTPSQFAENK